MARWASTERPSLYSQITREEENKLMRIAVIADTHGNLLALEAVLADLGGRGADLIVDLGDCASGPLWPRETMERLAKLDALAVRGNHDRQVAELAPEEMGASDSFAFGELTRDQRELLGKLPMTRFIAPGILACHATPARDDLYLIEEVENGRLVRDAPARSAKGSVPSRRGSCSAVTAIAPTS